MSESIGEDTSKGLIIALNPNMVKHFITVYEVSDLAVEFFIFAILLYFIISWLVPTKMLLLERLVHDTSVI